MEKLLTRLKNPIFLVALSGMIYLALKRFGITIEEGTFKDIVDLIAYVGLGTGIYSSYEPKEIE